MVGLLVLREREGLRWERRDFAIERFHHEHVAREVIMRTLMGQEQVMGYVTGK